MNPATNGIDHQRQAVTASTEPEAPSTPAASGQPTFGNGDDSGAAQPRDKVKLAEQIVRLVELSADLFHDRRGVAYATLNLGQPSGRVVQRTLRLRSRAFRVWAAREVRMANGQTVGASILDEALTSLEGIACFDRPTCDVHVRVSAYGDAIYIDLADDTGESIEVTSTGWRIVDQVPVRFVRPSGILPLPRPVAGGRVDELRGFLNVDDDGFVLVVAWTVSAYRPGRPTPALSVGGPQGSTKTTACSVARRLCDPNIVDLRSPPRNEDDLLVAACSSHVLGFDNLSGVPAWFSDALCRLITGGGLGKRTHYTDEDETILRAMRPIILNGIEDVDDRPDLAERCIALTLMALEDGARRDEATYWRDFTAVEPRILGAILDGVASALAHLSEVRVANLPRMADFLLWATAAESGLGLEPGTIAAAYDRNRTQVVAAALEASPVATALREVLRVSGGVWEGTPTELLEALGLHAPNEVLTSKAWPKAAHHLTGRLRRTAASLREIGVLVNEGHRGRGAEKERWITIRARSSAHEEEEQET